MEEGAKGHAATKALGQNRVLSVDHLTDLNRVSNVNIHIIIPDHKGLVSTSKEPEAESKSQHHRSLYRSHHSAGTGSQVGSATSQSLFHQRLKRD